MYTVFADIETSGLVAEEDDIIQIAAVAVEGPEYETLATFEVWVNPTTPEIRAKLNAGVFDGSNWDEGEWGKRAVGAPQALSRFCRFLRQYADKQLISKAGKPYKVAQLAGHNFGFDHRFLLHHYRKYNIFMPADMRYLDTLQLAMWYYHSREDLPQPENFKLVTLASHLGFGLEGAHDAFADIQATVELARQLKGRK